MKIIVRAPNWLGDCVMALPVLVELKNKFPESSITVAARKHLMDVFVSSPEVDSVVAVPRSTSNPLKLYFAGRKLRVDNYDFGVLLTNSFSSALWLLGVGAKRRIGFARDFRRFFLTDPLVPNVDILQAHQADYYLATLKPLGIDVELSNPKLYVSEQAKKEAEESLKNFELKSGYAIIAPFSAYGSVKDWSSASYAKTAKAIVDKYDLDVLITGTGAQKEMCAEVAAISPRVHNAAGLTSLAGFFATVAGARLYVGGDSGGAHVAAALSVPTVVIFGITEPSRTRSLGDKVAIVGKGGMITPNLRDPAVARAAREALDNISVEDIMMSAGEVF